MNCSDNKTYKYMVAVRCMTYNHAPYIEDALRGFSMQETAFPVVFIVIDDASTDGEPEVLRKWALSNLEEDGGNASQWKRMSYGELLLGTCKGKKNLLFALLLLAENHVQSGRKWQRFEYMAEWNDNAKYLATCEGDDYWTAPDKLQRQVEFLEKHQEYSFCVHNFKRYLEPSNQFIEGFRYKEDFSFDINGYLKYWPTQPLTSLVRSSATPSVEVRKKFRYYRDNHHYYLLLQKGMGYYMSDVMGVYRITGKGVWTSLDSVAKVEIDLRSFVELYNYNKKDYALKNKCINQYVLYLQTCKENNAPVKKEVKDLIWMGGRVKANAILLYSKLRKLIAK